MTFICEPIPQADLDRIDFAAQAKKMPGFAHTPTNWVVDRQREIYLVCYAMGGSQIDMPALYGFSYKGIGNIGLVVKEKADINDSWCVIYEITTMLVDATVQTYLKEIIPLIEESMKIRGNDFYRSKYTVRVLFPAQHAWE